MNATKTNGNAQESLTAPLSVVLVEVPEAGKTVTLSQLRAKNSEVFRKLQEAKRQAAKAQIAASEHEIVLAEYNDLMLTYKEENQKPLDKSVHLVTGESI